MLRDQLQLWKITSIQFTFVVGNVALTMKSPAHSSCLTLHIGFCVCFFAYWITYSLHTTYKLTYTIVR